MILAIESSTGPVPLAQMDVFGEAIRRATSTYDYRAAASLAGRWLDLWEAGRIITVDRFDPLDVAEAWRVMHGPRRPLPMLRKWTDIARANVDSSDVEEGSHLGVVLQATADLAFEAEGPTAALALYREMLGIFRNLPRQEWNVVVSLGKIGHAISRLEGAYAALPHYQEALDACRDLDEDLGSQESKALLSAVLIDVGDSLHQGPQPGAAQSFYKEALVIRRLQFEEAPTARNRATMAIALQRLGDVVYDLHGARAARPLFVELLEHFRAVAEETGTVSDRWNLGVSLSKVGEALTQIAGFATSRPYYEESLVIARALAGEIQTARACWRLADRLGTLGALVLKDGKVEQARPYFDELISVTERLLGPEVDRAAQGVLTSLNQFGAMAVQAWGLDSGLPYLLQGLWISRTLAAAYPEAMYQADVVECLTALGSAAIKKRNAKLATQYVGELLNLTQASVRSAPSQAAFTQLAGAHRLAARWAARQRDVKGWWRHTSDARHAMDRSRAAVAAPLTDTVLRQSHEVSPSQDEPRPISAPTAPQPLPQEVQQSLRELIMADASKLGVVEATPPAPVEPMAGRLAPCPCGSGKRYKHCCGALVL